MGKLGAAVMSQFGWNLATLWFYILLSIGTGSFQVTVTMQDGKFEK